MAEGNLCVRGDLRGLLSVEHSGDYPCVLFGAQRACDAPAVRRMLHDFGIPDDHVALGIAALGYAAPAEPKEVVKTGKIVIVE